MPNSTSQGGPQRPAASLSAWRIEQLAVDLCDVQDRGRTPCCVIHGNVVADRSSVCGHVRHIVDQMVAVVLEAEDVRTSVPVTVVPGSKPVEVMMEVSA